jgi:cell division septum initiation protein DivIVA
LFDAQNKDRQIKSEIETINSDIDKINTSIRGFNISKIQKDLEKHLPTLNDEMEKLTKKIEGVNKEIETKTNEKDALVGSRTDQLAEIKDYEQKLESMNKMEEFIKEKKKLDARQLLFDELITMFGKKEIPKKESKKILKNLNMYLNLVINKLSNKSISLKINDAFEMAVNLKDNPKSLTAKTVSEGEEHLINLSFVLALGLLTHDGKLSYFFADDVVAFQPDKNAQEIIMGLTDFQKKGIIKQVYLCTNRFQALKLGAHADKIITFDNGEYKITKGK